MGHFLGDQLTKSIPKLRCALCNSLHSFCVALIFHQRNAIINDRSQLETGLFWVITSVYISRGTRYCKWVFSMIFVPKLSIVSGNATPWIRFHRLEPAKTGEGEFMVQRYQTLCSVLEQKLWKNPLTVSGNPGYVNTRYNPKKAWLERFSGARHKHCIKTANSWQFSL